MQCGRWLGMFGEQHTKEVPVNNAFIFIISLSLI
jgi:hypothetical protein